MDLDTDSFLSGEEESIYKLMTAEEAVQIADGIRCARKHGFQRKQAGTSTFSTQEPQGENSNVTDQQLMQTMMDRIISLERLLQSKNNYIRDLQEELDFLRGCPNRNRKEHTHPVGTVRKQISACLKDDDAFKIFCENIEAINLQNEDKRFTRSDLSEVFTLRDRSSLHLVVYANGILTKPSTFYEFGTSVANSFIADILLGRCPELLSRRGSLKNTEITVWDKRLSDYKAPPDSDLISKLPKVKITPGGSIVNVQDDIRKLIHGRSTDKATLVQVDHYVNKKPTQWELRIRSICGNQIYSIFASPEDSIKSLYERLTNCQEVAQFCLFNPSAKGSEFRTLTNLRCSLRDCGLADRIILHMYKSE